MRGVAGTVLRSRVALLVVFVLVHAWLVYANLVVHPRDLSDVTIQYRGWVEHGLATGQWVGLQLPWVYPAVALIPMTLAAAGGIAGYGEKWLVIVCALDLVALFFLVGGRSRPLLLPGWLWTLFLLLLGPVALARIDSIAVPLVIVALALIVRRPLLAGMLLTIATWVKVWPVAPLLAAVIATRSRLQLVLAAVGTSILVVLWVMIAGRISTIGGFLFAQTGRGLQIEAPVSGLWLWRAIVAPEKAHIYLDRTLNTWQVSGTGAETVGAFMTPLLGLAVVAVIVAGLLAHRHWPRDATVFPLIVLTLTTALIVFNKVGSPQYIAWLAAPLVLLASTVRFRRWLAACITLILAIAALTQLVFPWFYPAVLRLHPVMVAVLSTRNLLLILLFVVAFVLLLRRRALVSVVTSVIP